MFERILQEGSAARSRLAQLETSEGFRVTVVADNVSNPPTDAELDTAFGAPATLEDGFVGLVDDNNAGTKVWLCAVVHAGWWYAELTKAV